MRVYIYIYIYIYICIQYIFKYGRGKIYTHIHVHARTCVYMYTSDDTLRRLEDKLVEAGLTLEGLGLGGSSVKGLNPRRV